MNAHVSVELISSLVEDYPQTANMLVLLTKSEVMLTKNNHIHQILKSVISKEVTKVRVEEKKVKVDSPECSHESVKLDKYPSEDKNSLEYNSISRAESNEYQLSSLPKIQTSD